MAQGHTDGVMQNQGTTLIPQNPRPGPLWPAWDRDVRWVVWTRGRGPVSCLQGAPIQTCRILALAGRRAADCECLRALDPRPTDSI